MVKKKLKLSVSRIPMP